MAVIEFINGKNRTYSGMKRAINYILREDNDSNIIKIEELKNLKIELRR